MIYMLHVAFYSATQYEIILKESPSTCEETSAPKTQIPWFIYFINLCFYTLNMLKVEHSYGNGGDAYLTN